MRKKLVKILVFVVLIGGPISYTIFNSWTSTLPQRFTIATLEIAIPAKGGRYAQWAIEINEEGYAGSSLLPSNYPEEVHRRKKYYVKFPVEYPSESVMLFDYPVPDNMPPPPAEGWTLEELRQLDPTFNFNPN
ncbi:MAG: hypothetical protein CMO01_17435 [Thalassobius sp.]|nr:hypothetical protein [Thalassovita sp.]